MGTSSMPSAASGRRGVQERARRANLGGSERGQLGANWGGVYSCGAGRRAGASGAGRGLQRRGRARSSSGRSWRTAADDMACLSKISMTVGIGRGGVRGRTLKRRPFGAGVAPAAPKRLPNGSSHLRSSPQIWLATVESIVLSPGVISHSAELVQTL